MKIMAVDLGHARTGIAISDIGERLASPVGTITEYVDERLLPKIADIAKEQKAEMIVVGHPRNMDGSRGEAAKRAEELAAKLEEMTGLPVKLWDERMTTVSAIGYLNQNDVRGKKRGLLSACPRPDLQDHVPFVVRILRKQQKLQLLFQFRQPDVPHGDLIL